MPKKTSDYDPQSSTVQKKKSRSRFFSGRSQDETQASETEHADPASSEYVAGKKRWTFS